MPINIRKDEDVVHTHTHTYIYTMEYFSVMGFLGGSVVKNLTAVQEMLETWVWSLGWEDPRRKAWQPIPLFLPGECHGQRSLRGYGSWSHEASDTTEATERAHMHFSAKRKNETLPFAANMDGPRDYHTKWISQRKINIIRRSLVYEIWNMTQMNLSMKQK